MKYVYVIKRTVTYDCGYKCTDWVKSVGCMVTLSCRSEAKEYATKEEAQVVVSRICRGVPSERYRVEKVNSRRA